MINHESRAKQKPKFRWELRLNRLLRTSRRTNLLGSGLLTVILSRCISIDIGTQPSDAAQTCMMRWSMAIPTLDFWARKILEIH